MGDKLAGEEPPVVACTKLNAIRAVTTAFAAVAAATVAAGALPATSWAGPTLDDAAFQLSIPNHWTGLGGTTRLPVAGKRVLLQQFVVADYSLPHSTAYLSGMLPLPPSGHEVIAVAHLTPTAATAKWPAVRRLRVPTRRIVQGTTLRVRYLGQAVILRVSFPRTPRRGWWNTQTACSPKFGTGYDRSGKYHALFRAATGRESRRAGRSRRFNFRSARSVRNDGRAAGALGVDGLA